MRQYNKSILKYLAIQMVTAGVLITISMFISSVMVQFFKDKRYSSESMDLLFKLGSIISILIFGNLLCLYILNIFKQQFNVKLKLLTCLTPTIYALIFVIPLFLFVNDNNSGYWTFYIWKNPLLIILMIMFIWVFFYIYLNSNLKYKILSLKLMNIMKKNDSAKYFKIIDKQLKKTRNKKIKDALLFQKVNGMNIFKDWHNIDELISSLEPSDSIVLHFYCKIIWDLFILDQIDEAKILVSKIENSSSKFIYSKDIKLCISIKNYFDKELQKSEEVLNEFLNTDVSDKYFEANVFYYLGLISKEMDEIAKSINFFKKVILFEQQESTIVKKARLILNELN